VSGGQKNQVLRGAAKPSAPFRSAPLDHMLCQWPETSMICVEETGIVEHKANGVGHLTWICVTLQQTAAH